MTEDSGSTQILYIRDPHDLEEIVKKCFNGNVRIEDEVTQRTDEDDYFVPSQYQLALLILLIVLVGLAIVVGLIVYFQ